MSSREAILARVREALGPDPTIPAVERAYRAAGEPGAVADPAATFAERTAEYRAVVHRCAEAELEGLLEELLTGLTTVAAPTFVARLSGTLRADEPPLSAADLDACDAVLTGCALAIAETGTIVLDGGPACGRRAISLVPDRHVCVVESDQVLAGVPEGIAALAPTAAAGMPLTFISGPSATSDIELERVEGVHGPRRLEVVLVERSGPGGLE